jgi:hypothetical protein
MFNTENGLLPPDQIYDDDIKLGDEIKSPGLAINKLSFDWLPSSFLALRHCCEFTFLFLR